MGIATFRRPRGLQRLLESLSLLVYRRRPRPRLLVIVVDNDAAGSAREVCTAMAVSGLAIDYRIEPRLGIPHARNAILAAVPPEAEFMCFVDDDEWVPAGWLDELLAAQARTRAACITGPVARVLPLATPRWLLLSELLDPRPLPDGARLASCGTSNVLVRMDAVRAQGLRFNPTFVDIGGEDADFFFRLHCSGAEIMHCHAAYLFDEYPEGRVRLGWVLRRLVRCYLVGIRIETSPRASGGTPAPRSRAYLARRASSALRCLLLAPFRGHLLRTLILCAAAAVAALAFLLRLDIRDYAPARLDAERAGSWLSKRANGLRQAAG